MGITLRDDQRRAIQWAEPVIRHEGGVLFADAPGYGKSYQALGLAQQMDARPVIVAPRVLVPMWQRYLGEWDMMGTVYAYGELGHIPLRMQRPGEKKVLLIVDEAHAFVNPSTTRYRDLARVCHGIPVVLLSATPFQNRETDGLYLLALFSGEAQWLVRHPTERTAGLSALMRRVCLYRSLRSHRPVRRRSFSTRCEFAQVARAAEAICIQGEPYALILRWLIGRRLSSYGAWAASLARARRYLEESCEAQRSGRTMTRDHFARHFAHGQRAFPFMLDPSPAQSIASEHIQRSIDALAACGEEIAQHVSPDSWDWCIALPRPLVIFSQYRATIDEIYRALRGRARVVRWTGAGIDSNYPRGCAAGIGTLHNAILLATDVAAEGIDLRMCETLVHADMHWNPMRTQQREGRVRRGGRTDPVDIWSPEYPQDLTQLWAMPSRRAYKAALPDRFMQADWDSAKRIAITHGIPHPGYVSAVLRALRETPSHISLTGDAHAVVRLAAYQRGHLLPAGAAAWLRSDGPDTRLCEEAHRRATTLDQRLRSLCKHTPVSNSLV